ncbi:modular serine protease isoform X2 [Helicoverpa armigera]|uniref:modular serine protease isoform X2 n=1 Tax=Helicoverpa armigera TaxID=29058 RepID=UPI0030833134
MLVENFVIISILYVLFLIWPQYISASPIAEDWTTRLICRNGEFRCNNGECVEDVSRCNGTTECSDGSDETSVLCRHRKPRSTTCELPPQPEHGSYTKLEVDNVPSYVDDYVVLNYTCNQPFRLIGKPFVICNNGNWNHELPTCQALCKLAKNLRTEYRCLLSGKQTGYKICDFMVPEGTRVQPVCKNYHYNPDGDLPIMMCKDGKWNYTATCVIDCGKPVSKGIPLMAGGDPAKRGELPWHAGIYSKKATPYEQICGGSIISSKVVVSAAHCFWESGHRMLPCKYAVAAGKVYRDWDDPKDDYVQRQDVIDIKIPPRFRGVETNFQDDLALVVLQKGLQFVMYIRPVCLDFDYKFDEEQLKAGSLGKVAGWGYTSAAGQPSPFLKVAELPIVSLNRCFNETPHDFTSFITTDKICAGYTNGTAVCKGDSGGGLAFPEMTGHVTRYYLRGLVSTAPSDDLNCNTQTITAFTHLLRHQSFIQSHFIEYQKLKFLHFDSRMVTQYNYTATECPN